MQPTRQQTGRVRHSLQPHNIRPQPASHYFIRRQGNGRNCIPHNTTVRHPNRRVTLPHSYHEPSSSSYSQSINRNRLNPPTYAESQYWEQYPQRAQYAGSSHTFNERNVTMNLGYESLPVEEQWESIPAEEEILVIEEQGERASGEGQGSLIAGESATGQEENRQFRRTSSITRNNNSNAELNCVNCTSQASSCPQRRVRNREILELLERPPPYCEENTSHRRGNSSFGVTRYTPYGIQASDAYYVPHVDYPFLRDHGLPVCDEQYYHPHCGYGYIQNVYPPRRIAFPRRFPQAQFSNARNASMNNYTRNIECIDLCSNDEQTDEENLPNVTSPFSTVLPQQNDINYQSGFFNHIEGHARSESQCVKDESSRHSSGTNDTSKTITLSDSESDTIEAPISDAKEDILEPNIQPPTLRLEQNPDSNNQVSESTGRPPILPRFSFRTQSQVGERLQSVEKTKSGNHGYCRDNSYISAILERAIAAEMRRSEPDSERHDESALKCQEEDNQVEEVDNQGKEEDNKGVEDHNQGEEKDNNEEDIDKEIGSNVSQNVNGNKQGNSLDNDMPGNTPSTSGEGNNSGAHDEYNSSILESESSSKSKKHKNPLKRKHKKKQYKKNSSNQKSTREDLNDNEDGIC